MCIIYIVIYVYSDIINNVKRTRQEKRYKDMKTWYVWGINLPKLEIKADSFDNAIAQARKINKNYNTGQLK